MDFVKRGSGAYTYWENGSLKSDANEQIANITYNTFLNQPELVTLIDGKWIKYTYLGSGELVKTEYSNGEIWEFNNGLIFKNGEFYSLNIPEGRAIYNGGSWQYEFDYKDHLGNTRVSFKADGSTLVQTAKTDMDPWGVVLKGTGLENSFQNRFEFQGKETEKTFGLNRINFGARSYNPTIGRFDRTDPMAEFFPGINPYTYAVNNPVLFNDRFGLYPSFGIMECPTCPKGTEFDVYRESSAFFTYKEGFVYNGAGTDVVVRGSSNQPIQAPVFNWPWQGDLGLGVSEWHLGRQLERLEKWDGNYRYPGSFLKKKDIDAKAIARQPLIKNRPVNIIRNVALPRDLAMKLAKGMKVAGGVTLGMVVADNISKSAEGDISWQHATTTIGVGVLGLVVGTLGTPIVLSTIAVGVIYSIYEDDIWHDFDKTNATNFLNTKE